MSFIVLFNFIYTGLFRDYAVASSEKQRKYFLRVPSGGMNQEVLARKSLEINLKQLLSQLGYPEEKIPEIVTEFNKLFEVIKFSELQKRPLPQDTQVLILMINQLVLTVREKYYPAPSSPPSLIKFLTNSLNNEDIFELIKDKNLEAKDIMSLHACAPITQLGYILLKLLNIDVLGIAAYGNFPELEELLGGHAALILSLPEKNLLIIDFAYNFVLSINTKEWYEENDNCLILKERHRLSFDEFNSIKNTAQEKGLSANESLKFLLNFSYTNIKKFHRHALTCNLYLNRGSLYFKLGRYADAVRETNESKRVDPNFIEPYFTLCTSYLFQNRVPDAIKVFKEIKRIYIERYKIFIDANLTDNWYQHRIRLLEELIYEQFRKLKEKIGIDLNESPFVQLLFFLGLHYFELKQYDQASEEFKAAIKNSPNFAYAYYYLGLCQGKAGDWFTAKENILEAIILKPKLAEWEKKEIVEIAEKRRAEISAKGEFKYAFDTQISGLDLKITLPSSNKYKDRAKRIEKDRGYNKRMQAFVYIKEQLSIGTDEKIIIQNLKQILVDAANLELADGDASSFRHLMILSENAAATVAAIKQILAGSSLPFDSSLPKRFQKEKCESSVNTQL